MDLAKAIEEGFVYSGQFSEYRRLRHGNSSRHIPPDKLVVFAQNHDQVGNRLFGERPGRRSLKGCNRYELDNEILDMEQLILSDLKTEYDNLSSEGFRVLAVAYKDFRKQERCLFKG